MTDYEFTCSGCATHLEFNDRQQSATVQSGCPLCGQPIAEADFATT